MLTQGTACGGEAGYHGLCGLLSEPLLLLVDDNHPTVDRKPRPVDFFVYPVSIFCLAYGRERDGRTPSLTCSKHHCSVSGEVGTSVASQICNASDTHGQGLLALVAILESWRLENASLDGLDLRGNCHTELADVFGLAVGKNLESTS